MTKQIFLLGYIFISVIVTSCSNADADVKPKNLPINYVLLIDVSDRLLYPNQAEKDLAVIGEVFNQFSASVSRNLTVKSKDRFSVRIMPQKGSPLKTDAWEDKLSLDMSALNPSEKASRFNTFNANFQQDFQTFYQQAFLGNQHKNYFGVDIWKYFKDQIESDLSIDHQNIVIVLTDGLFDFESVQNTIQQNNKFTHSNFIYKLNSPDWQEKADKEGWGYMPVSLPSATTKWIVCGIRAKDENDLLQNQKLKFFWEKWLQESGAEKRNVYTDLDASSDKLKTLIRNQVK